MLPYGCIASLLFPLSSTVLFDSLFFCFCFVLFMFCLFVFVLLLFCVFCVLFDLYIMFVSQSTVVLCI